jgi:hypothetical protein
MSSNYHVRWVSKRRAETLRKEGLLRQASLLDSFNGFLLIEPVGTELGDGPVLSPQEADYELQGVWCPGPKAELERARRLIGLDQAELPSGLVAAG